MPTRTFDARKNQGTFTFASLQTPLPPVDVNGAAQTVLKERCLTSNFGRYFDKFSRTQPSAYKDRTQRALSATQPRTRQKKHIRTPQLTRTEAPTNGVKTRDKLIVVSPPHIKPYVITTRKNDEHDWSKIDKNSAMYNPKSFESSSARPACDLYKEDKEKMNATRQYHQNYIRTHEEKIEKEMRERDRLKDEQERKRTIALQARKAAYMEALRENSSCGRDRFVALESKLGDKDLIDKSMYQTTYSNSYINSGKGEDNNNQ